MQKEARSLARAAPWRSGAHWWLPVVEGLVAVAAGIALLVWTEESTRVILWIVGVLLLVNSALWIYAGMRRPDEGSAASPARPVQGGIGLIVGVFVVAQPFVEAITAETALLILAAGLIAIGVIGLYDAALRHERRLSAGLIALLALALGGLLLYASLADAVLVRWAGFIVLVFGLLLLGYGAVLYLRRPRPADVALTP